MSEQFDLEQFVNMFDEALTSKDERVINALRSLMMIVVLARPDGDKVDGPFRKLNTDVYYLMKKVQRLENELELMLRKTATYSVSASSYNDLPYYTHKITTPWDTYPFDKVDQLSTQPSNKIKGK